MQHSCRAHPWHGVSLGVKAPEEINSYIEIVPTDTVKYELDKKSGLLRIDRPQQYSNCCPCLYGLLPQTFCGKRIGDYCSEQAGIPTVSGDLDPLDICVFTEKAIVHGDILVRAIPIGGIRILDDNEADDKLLAVLAGDSVYGDMKDVSECPEGMIERLIHYFLTYKDHPEKKDEVSTISVLGVYGREEAMEVLRLAQEDYAEEFGKEVTRAL